MNNSYFTIDVNTENYQRILHLPYSEFGALGVEEFSMDEQTVDRVLGEKSLSGGSPDEQTLDLIERENQSSGAKYYFSTEKEAKRFQLILGELGLNPVNEIRLEQTKDWDHLWRANLKPIELSSNFKVIPLASIDESPSEQGNAYVYPGMGFGTGGHETTSLCLKLMSSLELEGVSRILDYGCGSGILGVSALKFFDAKSCDFLDNDKDALLNTKQNIDLNKQDHLSRLFLAPGENSKLLESYDLVFANILFNTLDELKDEILSKTGKYLIVSGLLSEQVYDLINLYQGACVNLKVQAVQSQGDWGAVLFYKNV